MKKVKEIRSLKILDSRGHWTVEASITLEGGFRGTGSVPSGASLSSFEALNVPAEAAVSFITELISPKIIGKDFSSQEEFDKILLSFDESSEKSKIGGNTLLVLSLAFCKASAAQEGKHLYRYIDSLFEPSETNLRVPQPIFNLINGGRHTVDGLDFQEFLVMPNFKKVSANVEAGEKIYQSLESLLLSNNLPIDVGDEGGFAPKGLTIHAALNFLLEATRAAGFKAGEEVYLGLDCAASQLIIGDLYRFTREERNFSAPELRDYYLNLAREFPLIYLEDPLGEKSFSDWSILRRELAGKVEVVGDDLIATNEERVNMASLEGAVSAVIIKPNQAGTLSETLSAVGACRRSGFAVVASHRSGDTPDAFIADFACGIGAKYLKAGAPARGERTAKYNRLLEIESELET